MKTEGEYGSVRRRPGSRSPGTPTTGEFSTVGLLREKPRGRQVQVVGLIKEGTKGNPTQVSSLH